MTPGFNKYDLWTAVLLALALLTVIPLVSLGYPTGAAMCALGFLVAAAMSAKQSIDLCFKQLQKGS